MFNLRAPMLVLVTAPLLLLTLLVGAPLVAAEHHRIFDELQRSRLATGTNLVVEADREGHLPPHSKTEAAMGSVRSFSVQDDNSAKGAPEVPKTKNVQRSNAEDSSGGTNKIKAQRQKEDESSEAQKSTATEDEGQHEKKDGQQDDSKKAKSGATGCAHYYLPILVATLASMIIFA